MYDIVSAGLFHLALTKQAVTEEPDKREFHVIFDSVEPVELLGLLWMRGHWHIFYVSLKIEEAVYLAKIVTKGINVYMKQ